MRLVPTIPRARALPRRDVLETLHALGYCRTLVRLLVVAGFGEDLASPGPPITLFAPTDAAFARIAGGGRALLDPARDEMLIDLLEYHLVRGRIDLGAAVAAGGARSVHGAEIHLCAEAGEIWADAARVRQAGIPCDNGVIHLVDSVLAPALSEGRVWISMRAAEPKARAARSRLRGRRTLLDDMVPPSGLHAIDASADDDGDIPRAEGPESSIQRRSASAASGGLVTTCCRDI
ncbi:MAG: fasciclin domain-containing protein [Byssovorax sp.]